MRSLPDILYNFHWIAPGQAARSSQAWARLLGPFLGARGIKAVINLRGPNPDWRWWHYERRVCAARGIAHRDAMLSSKNLPTRAMLLSLLDAFDAVPRPFLVKCSGGQDRTSLAAALYLLHRDGWDALPAAEVQFARWPYLHLPKPHQLWLRQLVAYAAESAAGQPLRAFIETGYAPEIFAEWLRARGLGTSFKAIAKDR